MSYINKQDFEESYRGPDRHGRGHYPVRPPRPADSGQVQRIQNEALFTAIMEELGGSRLADFGNDERRAAYPARKVEAALRHHLGLSSNPQILKSSNPQ